MKVLLLAGGTSGEREVSLASGEAVHSSLRRQGHMVFAIDPASGKSLLGSDGKFLTSSATQSDLGSVVSTPRASVARHLSRTLGSPGFQDIDVVFVALHGGSGEDGSIQCLVDLAGKKFTGSGMAASAIAMDKALAKRLFESESIPTPEWGLFRLRSRQIDDRLVDEINSRFDLPFIVKPNNSGSTLGVTKVTAESGLRDALKTALAESTSILVEEFIDGRELTVSVLDGQALPVVEIIPSNELYDYEAKYSKGRSQYLAPADLDDAMAVRLQESAVRAYNVIGADGLARIDFIYDEAADRFFCLELNCLPGMTELSLSPMAAQAAGITFDRLVERMLKSALDK
ncbi:MAG: D-alanine--D-alanine ligase [Candidatus Zixiibacteriota bacterium]